MKGTYCLIIALRKQSTFSVGRLGELEFKPGFYVYVGSALNSLEARVKRHLSDEKKIHWHVDYLSNNSHSNIKEVIFSIGEEKIECSLASLISEKSTPITNFGCSDCKCNSHLFYFEEYNAVLKVILDSFKELDLSVHNLNELNTIKN